MHKHLIFLTSSFFFHPSSNPMFPFHPSLLVLPQTSCSPLTHQNSHSWHYTTSSLHQRFSKILGRTHDLYHIPIHFKFHLRCTTFSTDYHNLTFFTLFSNSSLLHIILNSITENWSCSVHSATSAMLSTNNIWLRYPTAKYSTKEKCKQTHNKI